MVCMFLGAIVLAVWLAFASCDAVSCQAWGYSYTAPNPGVLGALVVGAVVLGITGLMMLALAIVMLGGWMCWHLRHRRFRKEASAEYGNYAKTLGLASEVLGIEHYTLDRSMSGLGLPHHAFAARQEHLALLVARRARLLEGVLPSSEERLSRLVKDASQN